jgi:hypothetical protein
VLSAGASCVVSVTFTPETLGPAAATLTVGSTEGASSALQLDGNGIPQTPPASIEVTPGSLAATLEPDQMQALDLSIANLGGEALDWQVDDRPGFRRVDRVDLAHVDYVTASAIDPSGHYAYFGGSNDNRGDMISKVDLSTFEEVADIETDGFDTGYTSAVVDPAGHYAYFGTYTVPGVIVKIDLDTFQQVASITLPSGDYFLDAAVMDPAGRYAYFFGYTSGKVIKLDLDAFAVVGTLTLPEAASDAITAGHRTRRQLCVHRRLPALLPAGTVAAPRSCEFPARGVRRHDGERASDIVGDRRARPLCLSRDLRR